MEKSYIITLEYDADSRTIKKIEEFAHYKLGLNDVSSFSGNAAFGPSIRLESTSEKEVDKAAKELLTYCKRFKNFKESL